MRGSVIYDLMETWEFGKEINREMAQVIYKNVDELMEKELRDIDDLLQRNKLNLAFVSMMRLTSFINSGVAKLPSIIRKLEKWVDRLRSSANLMAKKFKAESFSISVGLPAGISVGLSFAISKAPRHLRI